MKIPVPYKHAGKTVSGIELARPRGGVLADTRKLADEGNIYGALSALVAGSISEILYTDGSNASSPEAIRNAAEAMPYESANFVATQSFLNLGVESEIDQLWRCPRCNHTWEDEPDYRPSMEALEVHLSEDAGGEPMVPVIDIQLSYPVEIKDRSTGEVKIRVSSMEFRFPSIRDGIDASRRVSVTDATRVQFAAFVNAIEKINGSEVDKKWKNQWGMLVFERLDPEDLSTINGDAARYGIVTEVERTCPKCGKHFSDNVSTSSFFASGLRQK